MLRSSLDLLQLSVGQALPERGHTFTEVDLMAYGAATWDWHRLHFDKDHAKSMQLPGVVIDGQVFGAVFARESMHWAGPKAFIESMSLEMKSMAFAGDHLVAKGTISAIDHLDNVCMVRIAQQLLCGDRLVAQSRSTVRINSN
jgi:acyl dehydratase